MASRSKTNHITSGPDLHHRPARKEPHRVTLPTHSAPSPNASSAIHQNCRSPASDPSLCPCPTFWTYPVSPAGDLPCFHRPACLVIRGGRPIGLGLRCGCSAGCSTLGCRWPCRQLLRPTAPTARWSCGSDSPWLRVARLAPRGLGRPPWDPDWGVVHLRRSLVLTKLLDGIATIGDLEASLRWMNSLGCVWSGPPPHWFPIAAARRGNDRPLAHVD